MIKKPKPGPATCATDKQSVYAAAYKPRFAELVRKTTNAFMNGIASISATVNTATNSIAMVVVKKGGVSNNKYAPDISKEPSTMK